MGACGWEDDGKGGLEVGGLSLPVDIGIQAVCLVGDKNSHSGPIDIARAEEDIGIQSWLQSY